MSNIHPNAVIDNGATIGDNVTIGPFCVVGEHVVLGDNVCLESHVAINGHTTIGEKTHIFPFASLGSQPQDLKFSGEVSKLVIGSNNMIREHVTMNPGTKGGGLLTEVGNNCLFMVGAHVAHDCRIEDNVILVNNATLGGHVEVGENAILGGLSAVHQFVRIGKHSMIGGMTGVENDVIPYGSVIGNRAKLSGLNIIGLRRRNFSREDIHSIRKAYRLIFATEGTLTERLEHVATQYSQVEAVMDIVNFIQVDSSRAICQPGQGDAA